MKNKMLIGGGICLAFLPLLYRVKRPAEQYLVSDKRITVIAPFSNEGYWGNVCNGAIEEGKNWGIDVKCLSSVDNDEDNLIQNMRSAIYSNVDGIISYGLDGSEVFQDLMEEADLREIPVVIVDSDVKSSPKLCYVGTDNYHTGYLAGEDLASECKGKGKILVVVSFLATDNQKERMAGFCDALNQYPDMHIVNILEGKSNIMLGQKLVLDALEKYDEIDGIYCAEGISTYSVCYAIQELEETREPIPIIVYEYGELIAQAMEKGDICTAIVQKPEEMGKQAMRALGQYLEQAIIPEEKIYTDILLLKHSNLEEGKSRIFGSDQVPWHYY